MDVLVPEGDRAVVVARNGPCIPQASLTRFLSGMRGVARKDVAPDDAVAIETAARRIGGREKPWGAIFAALLAGEIDFWLASGNVTSRSVVVIPTDIADFDDVSFDQHVLPDDGEIEYPIRRSTNINKNDAEELLNVHPKHTRMLIEEKLLTFTRKGQGLVTEKAAVLRLAERMVAPAELCMLTGLSLKLAREKVKGLCVRPIGCGWSRQDLVERGIVPSR